MQAYDIIMLVVLAAATLFGMIKGFAWQVASLASIIVSYFVAYNFRDQVAARIQVAPPMNTFIAMLLLYAGASFAIWVVFRLISSSIDRVRLRDFDRQMGALFGLGKGIMYCLLITMFAMTLLGQQQQRAIVESRSGRYISTMLTAAKGVMLPGEIETVIRPHLERVRQQLEGGAVATDPNSLGAPATPWSNPQPSSSAPWTSGLANQVSEIAGSLLNGQGPNAGQAPPVGMPTSRQEYSPDQLNHVFESARDALANGLQQNVPNTSPVPNMPPAGQGGWTGSGSAPLPNYNPFNGQSPSAQSPALTPNTNINNRFQQQPQYDNVLPFR